MTNETNFRHAMRQLRLVTKEFSFLTFLMFVLYVVTNKTNFLTFLNDAYFLSVTTIVVFLLSFSDVVLTLVDFCDVRRLYCATRVPCNAQRALLLYRPLDQSNLADDTVYCLWPFYDIVNPSLDHYGPVR